MKKIRGKTLKGWKDYCKNDSVPIKTMKYILCLEEWIKQLAIPVSCELLNDKYTTDFQEFLKDKCKEVKRTSLWLYKGNEWDIDYLYRKYNKRIKPNL